jgi:hAT family C-terminal dimerisation region
MISSWGNGGALERFNQHHRSWNHSQALVNRTFKLKSPIGFDFYQKLVGRLNERKYTPIISLAIYLTSSNYLSRTNATHSLLKLSKKSAVQELGTWLLNRLFPTNEDSPDKLEDKLNDGDDENSPNFRDKLEQFIGFEWEKLTNSPTTASQKTSLQKDLRFYKLHERRSPKLDQLLLATCSVQPTLTQIERNFSLVENIVTKLRNRLSSEHLDDLCFLKSHFL